MLLPWRPPGGRPPTPGEIALCLPFLLRHIALAAPRRLVLLGALPARALLGGTGRKAPRAGWAELVVPGLAAPLAALLMASPAAALTSPAARREAWAALRLLRRALDADPG
jgi:DNA polymerase